MDKKENSLEEVLTVALGGLMIRKNSDGKYPNVGEIIKTIMPHISEATKKAEVRERKFILKEVDKLFERGNVRKVEWDRLADSLEDGSLQAQSKLEDKE